MVETPPRACAYYRALFGPYIDGSIDAPARRELAAHLAECKECASVFGMEWKANLEEKTGVSSPAAKRPRPTGLPFTLPFLRGGRRSAWILMALALGGILVLSRMGRRGGGERGGAPSGDVLEETVDLLRSQRRLNDAVIQVALGRKTRVPKEVKLQALEALRTIREALLGGRDSAGKADALLHPLFRIEEIGPGGTVERTIDKAALLRDPALAADFLEADQFQWWSADDETVCLYSFGGSGRDRSFLVFLRDEKGRLSLYWVLRKVP